MMQVILSSMSGYEVDNTDRLYCPEGVVMKWIILEDILSRTSVAIDG